jgi:hypothetical protein
LAGPEEVEAEVEAVEVVEVEVAEVAEGSRRRKNVAPRQDLSAPQSASA